LNASPAASSPALGGSENAKLLSLLALAAGAAAIPNASEADIVYTDLGASPGKVGFSAGFGTSFSIALPSAHVKFKRTHSAGSNFSHNLVYAAGPNMRRNSNGSIAVTGAGKTFSDFNHAGTTTWKGQLGARGTNGGVGSQSPSSGYTDEYMAFIIQPGGNYEFGWVELSLDLSHSTGPDLTIEGYAYDDRPYQPPYLHIHMGDIGSVPEPGQVAGMGAVGAMVLGAAGLRAWRRTKS
jgi:hypothetical protein